MNTTLSNYYNAVWEEKLNLENYSTLEKRWRSRWDFATDNIKENSLVLDVSCGDGILGEGLINNKNCEVYGVDIAKYALDISKSRGIKISLCDVSSEKLPFDDNKFDYVVNSCALEHIMNPHYAVSEMTRVLKHNGYLIITLPNVAYFYNRIEFLRGRTSKDFLHSNPGEGMHFQFYNYTDEFENRIVSKFDNLEVTYKKGDLKNPKKYSPFTRRIFYVLIKLFPNLFSQYTHWVIKKV